MRKSNNALVIYYLAIGCLVLLVGVIIVKLSFWPSCTITGPVPQNGLPSVVCVDGWSIAGLAATILGVSATILTLIGALAVAAWWTGLENRVDTRVTEQVDELFKERVEQRVSELLVQAAAFKELQARVASIGWAEDDLDRQSKAFQEYVLNTVIGPLFLGIPWRSSERKQEALEPIQTSHGETAPEDVTRNAIPFFEPYLILTAPYLAVQIIFKIFDKYYQTINQLLSEASSDLNSASKRASDHEHNDPRCWLNKVSVLEPPFSLLSSRCPSKERQQRRGSRE